MAACRHMVPQAHGSMLIAKPPPRPAAKRLRRKNSTLEKILQHANDYMNDIALHDPRGEELQKVAFARHTLRLKEKHGLDPSEELTVHPEAVSMLTQHAIARPRIVRHPADVEATQGISGSITLEVKANVRR